MVSNGKTPLKTPRREKSNMSTGSESEAPKDVVEVYCRMRNLPDEKEPSCIKLISPTVLSISCPSESKVMRRDSHYSFKHIFTSYASQKELFEHVALPLLEDLVKGKNGLLFTYGVTGSGKTYTLTGDPYNPGIMPRCIDTLFNTIGEFQAPKYVIKSDRMNGFEVQSESDAFHDCRSASKSSLKKRGAGDAKSPYSNDGIRILGIDETNLYAVFVSYVEIYNNTVFDLLDESGGKSLQSKILREDCQKNMYVNGVVEVEVKSAAEAFELFNLGQRRKRMGQTLLNVESSRSHSILNIRVVQLEQVTRNSRGERVVPDRNLLKVSQLSLVDLAGSERCSRTQNQGVRLKEASSINNSLMSLRSCLEILRDNQKSNGSRLVPYRDSRLTLLFKNYFEGDGRVKMIVCLNPSVQNYDENLQVMKFAELTQDVKVVKPESRYTPYRKTYKETPRKTPMSKIKSLAPIVFGPDVPTVKLNLENHGQTMESVLYQLKVLQSRKQKSAGFDREETTKERHFRKRLGDINQNVTLKTAELQSAQQQYKKEKKKNQNLEVKILELENIAAALEDKNSEFAQRIETLRSNLDEKNLKLNQNLIEKEKHKQKLALKAEKMSRELDEKLRRQRDHLNAVMQAKEHKLQKMREVLDDDDDDGGQVVQREVESQPPSTPRTYQQQPPSTPRTYQQPQTYRTPSARKNGTFRRRSRSVGEEVWLEHNSVKPVPLGTVLQPTMKKRKSVTKLSKASDITNQKQSKYCLIAQEEVTDGELETKVYKADIVPTTGGGAQVIFNDVERLRQESPTK